jgi:4-diphosphocytidyl-2-C-methyl-D-erythritol kinase
MRVIDDGPAVLARSPAKLNLFLAVRGRRPDGFHEIETLMVKVSHFDGLRFSPRTDDRLTLAVRRIDPGPAPPTPTGPENLVLRAAELLQHHAGIRFGADILLEKRIPSEAGLAGGSGNAAAALAGLNRLWRLGLTRHELADLAARLGSDVPFFLSGANAAVATGRGERIEPVAIGGPLHVVIVKPAFGLPTAGVYRTFAEQCRPSDAESKPLVRALSLGRLASASRLLKNDLMDAAERIAPQVIPLRKRLAEECRHGGLMTGSGSACFGLCGSAREATTVAARLRAAGLGRVLAATSA